jgi:hypothetical protein
MRIATPGVFRVLGTPMLEGRDFDAGDRTGSPPVAIVGRHLARRFWGAERPLGRAITRRAPDGSFVAMTVVGVVEEAPDRGLLPDSIWLPYAQLAGHEAAETVHVMVRRAGPLASTGREISRAVAGADPRIGIASIASMEDLFRRTLASHRLGSAVLSSLAGFGLFLAALGVAGIVSFFALHRRPELAIRAAVGASPSQIRRLVLRQGAAAAASGSAIGLVLALAAQRALAHAVADLAPRPLVGAGTALALFLVTLVASDLPARRAAAADPLESLRNG